VIPVALTHYLAPLSQWLCDSAVNEVMINDPGFLFVEKSGDIFEQSAPELTHDWLQGVARLVATHTIQRLSDKEPLLSAQLPDGHRVQIVLPPACESGKVIIAIRRQVIHRLTLEDYINRGAFEYVKPCYLDARRTYFNEEETELGELFKSKQWVMFLRKAIKYKKNILIAGGTSTGKTTFLNACLREIPLDERIITLEDVREVQIQHKNRVHLLASKNDQSVAKISMAKLVETCLRLRPDRIILGELRGEEALDFMQAASTGHDGTLASIHASNPHMALLRLSGMVQSNPRASLSRPEILTDLYQLIDIVVQMKKVKQPDGKSSRVISEIYSAFNLPALKKRRASEANRGIFSQEVVA
jgi:type IV secretion system protein VirB11